MLDSLKLVADLGMGAAALAVAWEAKKATIALTSLLTHLTTRLDKVDDRVDKLEGK
jgi:hypothetical protein